jgi:hypothetical protein
VTILLLALVQSAPLLELGPHADARLAGGARRGKDGFEFTTAAQAVETDAPRGLDGARAMSVGGWFLPKGTGEQLFFHRGFLDSGPNGERMFPPNPDRVDFLVGTDRHGFFMGAVNGNGHMPFPFVTLNEVRAGAWNQLVVVKTAEGHQKFYQNGALVWTDLDAAAAPKATPFRESAPGPPVRLSLPLGGTAAEAWIYARELEADEIRRDYEAKKERYAPAPPGRPVALRDMDARRAPDLWKEPVTRENWPATRERILRGVREIFGPMPAERAPLDPRALGEEDCGTYVRRKVSIQVEPGDRMPAYVLVPKGIKGRAPAVICFYGTTSGAGKETTVGLSGPKPGTPPAKNRAFAVDFAEAGFVAFAADYLRDGERVAPGRRPYDTTGFYEKHPDWSIHGKDAWDTMRAVDYLESLDFVDGARIGMVGHSYGGHSTIFTMMFEPRIKAGWANGPVSDFVQHGMHWASPKGGGSSQSLPAMRPYLLEKRPPPITFYEATALVAPRALAVGQAVGERRPREEENCAAVREVYAALGAADRVRYVWYPGDHDFPPQVRKEAVEWLRRGLGP